MFSVLWLYDLRWFVQNAKLKTLKMNTTMAKGNLLRTDCWLVKKKGGLLFPFIDAQLQTIHFLSWLNPSEGNKGLYSIAHLSTFTAEAIIDKQMMKFMLWNKLVSPVPI